VDERTEELCRRANQLSRLSSELVLTLAHRRTLAANSARGGARRRT
jgi:hypothetical protein